jgi:riboflavin biosynthesis pyrimidine reductase
MRRLLPEPSAAVDLDEAYAVPGGPHVRANFVCSVDGSAMADGRSAGLSSPADKALFSRLRRHCDVVLVGAGTVRTETYGPARPSPEGRARREALGFAPVPPIAVVSGTLDLDETSAFFVDAVARPIVLTVAMAPAERRAALSEVAEVVMVGEGLVDPVLAVAALAERGLPRVLCEGGPSLLGGLVAAGQLDELCLTLSPVLAGAGGSRIVGGPISSVAAPMTLLHVLEDDGFLFLRYARPA